MKKTSTAEEKKAREAQTKAHAAAGWRRVLRLNQRGGGSFVMERSSK